MFFLRCSRLHLGKSNNTQNRPLCAYIFPPNSFYSTSNGQHVYVYDNNGKLIYDLSSERVKYFKINYSPTGEEFFQPDKLSGSVPKFIKEMFGWQ